MGIAVHKVYICDVFCVLTGGADHQNVTVSRERQNRDLIGEINDFLLPFFINFLNDYLINLMILFNMFQIYHILDRICKPSTHIVPYEILMAIIIVTN